MAESVTAAPPATRGKVLLVDDRQENIVALESILKELDADLVAARSGEEALLKVLDDDFAVILLDVQMPGMDGFETASLIRSRERSRLTPIIFVTASIAERDAFMFKGYRHGAVDYLFKPFSPEILRSKVAVFVELFQKTQQLERRTADLARSNQALEQFAYVASHDLREPLRKITGFAQLLESRYKGKLDAEADRIIGYVVDGAARLQNLISDLLEYSRSGKPTAEYTDVLCGEVFERVIENLGVQIQETRAVITHDELPSVRGDASQLLQLFQNLISNALKFRGADQPIVHVGVRAQDGRWLFAIQDNGIGIEPKYQGQLFTLFKRLNSREKYPGTGIGLAICKRVVEAHGGRIWIESLPGEGSTFYFTLPGSRAK